MAAYTKTDWDNNAACRYSDTSDLFSCVPSWSPAVFRLFTNCHHISVFSLSVSQCVCVDVDVATVKDCLYSMFFTDHV